MASAGSQRKSCSKCSSRQWVIPCEGCHELFCIMHAGIHREELATQLDVVQQQSNHLHNIFNQYEKLQEHPLFSAIDVWEHDCILKIQQTAQKARNDIKQLHEEVNTEMKTMFNQFDEQIRSAREHREYTEIEINQWKEQLLNIKKQLETPCDIELIKDNSLPSIDLIKINSTKKSITMLNPSCHQTGQIHDDKSSKECLINDDVDKTETSTDKENHTPTIESNSLLSKSQSNDSSTALKEEPQTTLSTLTISPVLLDPTKTHHVLLLQSCSTIQSNLVQILKDFTDDQLRVLSEEEDLFDQIKSAEQTTLFIDNYLITSDEGNCLLDNISQLDNVQFMYIRGIPPKDDDERDIFFNRHTKVKAVFESEQRLTTQWILDTVNEYRKTGDFYCDAGDKEKGRECFEKGIALYKSLSTVLDKIRRPQLNK